MSVEVSKLQNEARHWIRERLGDVFGSPRVVSYGVLYEADTLPGMLARFEGEIAGFLTYDVRRDAMEVVALVSIQPGAGVGEALLDAAADRARALGCRRLWLVTTNDNGPAQRLYQKCGMKCVEIRKGAIAAARKLKPEIPQSGIGGVAIEDEWVYEIRLEAESDDAGKDAGGDDAPSP